MSAACLTNHALRETVMDFVAIPFFTDHETAIFKKPDDDQTMHTAFFKPFKHTVWLAVLSSVPLGGIFIWLISVTGESKQCMSKLAKLKHSFWFAYGAILNQSKSKF